MADSIAQAVLENAERDPHRPFATVLQGRSRYVLTYGELASRALEYAGWYAHRGVERGNCIVIMLGYGHEVFPAFVGAMIAGAIPSIFAAIVAKQDPAIFWRSHELAFERIEPALILSDDAGLEQVRRHLPSFAARSAAIGEVAASAGTVHVRADPGDVAFLQHSSGTTGQKKGVQLRHKDVLQQVTSYAQALDIRSEDVIATWLPLYHDMGLIACFMLPGILGLSTVYIDPFEWVVKPALLLDAIEEFGATLAWLPNFAFHHILRAAPAQRTWNLASVRALIDCSEPCKPDTFAAFRERFAASSLPPQALQVSYALAEYVFAITQTDVGREPRVLVADRAPLALGRIEATDGRDTAEFLSCGPPIAGARVRIVDPAGQNLPERTIGQIVVSGPCLFAGYHRLEVQKIIDGWYWTGDLGFLDAGELFVTGRIDDLLIIHGKNLYAHDVEHALADITKGRAAALGVFSAVTGSQDLIVVAERTAGGPPDAEVVRAIKAIVFASFGTTASDVRIVAPGWIVKTTSGKMSRHGNLVKYVGEFRPEANVTAPR